MANTKSEQHSRARNPGRRDGARSRRRGRVFASDDPNVVKQRDDARREKRRLARAKAERDARTAARIAEVPETALEPYELYRLEVEKRRRQGLPTLRPIEEHRQKAGAAIE